MKIVIATPMYPPEIAEPASYSKEVASRLSKDHEITVVAYASTSKNTPEVKLITISKQKPLPFRFIKFTIALYKASLGSDIIYAQSGMVSSIPAVLVGHFLHIPVVLNYMEDEPWRRATLLRLTDLSSDSFLKQTPDNYFIRFLITLQGFVLHKASWVITPTAYQKKNIFLTYDAPEEKTVIIHNPTKKEEILPFTEETILHQITISTNLVSWSGVDAVIRAVSDLKREFPDIKLLICGNGPEKDNLKSLAVNLSTKENIEFLGKISRAETWHHIKSSEIYIESTTEGTDPDTILWSLSAGTPVVAGNVPGIQEVIINENSGLLVRAGHADDFTQAIRKVFSDTELRRLLIDGGKKIVAEKFSWTAHLRGLNELFSSLQKYE